ncbi:AraC family transcriptional regulator [Modicisalibacter luteus]|uniref:Helix-turn-helix domain-containing protein n=2 Tax=Modicisalibacter luteus TaxID=453962 RepID=A0ABV7M772_9GAMM|nr:AraC family transcriptional regulator [Halomonas lutea]GHA88837.1 transcriptional regulator [Halomonas lutea]
MSFFNLRTCTLMQQYIAHEHSYHQLVLATSGVTELQIEGRGERITRERGCLIPSTYHHEYVGDGANRTLVMDIPLANLGLTSCADEVGRLFERPRFFEVPVALYQLANGLLPQVEQNMALHTEIATLILRAIYLNLHDEVLPASPLQARARSRLDLKRLDNFIDTHLGEAILVDDLASLCALSPGHFHACFREHTGMTPLAYVQQRRLAHARELIETSGQRLGQIATLVGFRDQGSFSRAYRRAFGVAPSTQRRGLDH